MYRHHELPLYKVLFFNKCETQEQECFASLEEAEKFALLHKGEVYKNFRQNEDGSYHVAPYHNKTTVFERVL